MSACCLFGVCIPYSAILPLVLIVLQYLAKPLYNAGLLPEHIALRIGLVNKSKGIIIEGEEGEKTDKSNGCSSSSCCDGNSTVKESKDEDENVVTIESMEQYKSILSKYNTVIVKFTAEWCKPCKVIHPFYATELATRYNSKNRTSKKFCVVDVDELDDVASECSVSILPCFVAFKDGKIVDKYTGSDEKKLETFVQV